MFLKTYQYADVTTGALEERDLAKIMEEDCPGMFAKTSGEYGSFFYLPEDEADFTHMVGEWAAYGLSNKFLAVMVAAKAQNIPYVRFDGDGAEVDDAEPVRYGHHHEHETFTRATWTEEVYAGNVVAGYHDWVLSQVEEVVNAATVPTYILYSDTEGRLDEFETLEAATEEASSLLPIFPPDNGMFIMHGDTIVARFGGKQ